jgi:hypothetical protein
MLKLINVIMHWYGIQETGMQGEKLVVGNLAVFCFCTYLCETCCIIDVSALEFQKIGKIARNTCEFKRLFQSGKHLLWCNAALVMCTSRHSVY